MSLALLDSFLRRPRGVTRGTVHMRSRWSVGRVMATVVIAALPCLLVGIYNTGYQANAGLLRLGAEAPADWRAELLRGVGLSLDPESFAACVLHGVLYLGPALLVAWVAQLLCELLFARLRGRARGEGLLATSLVFTLLLPPATPLWQVGVGMCFGTIFAKELFGGTGMGFVCVPAAGAALLALAWPDAMVGDPLWPGMRGHAGVVVFAQVAGGGAEALTQADLTWQDAFLGWTQGRMGTTSVLACGLGAALLIVRGIASWRAVVGMLLGALAALLLLGMGSGPRSALVELGWGWHVSLGTFAFASVFLVPDLNAGPLTDAGRWMLGLVVGSLMILIRVANPMHLDGAVLAVLFGNVCTPLFDSAAVWWHTHRGRRCDDG